MELIPELGVSTCELGERLRKLSQSNFETLYALAQRCRFLGHL